MPSLSEIDTLIQREDYEKALSELGSLSPADDQERSEAAFYRGRALEARGDWGSSADAYREAMEADEDNVEAIFRLAYLLDLHGEDEEALELYEQCVAEQPLHVNALLNLAVLYEDGGRFDDAERCLEMVVEECPEHPRARLFLKDVQSSKTMYYDEDQERVKEQHSAVLDMPIAEFELSVRARNCLKQMNIHTLGDLLKVTESDLMVYKNFGETSLNEIKAMLAQRGLRLGQMLETKAAETQDSQLPTMGSTGIYARPVTELELSVRARKCLQRLGISSLGELAARNEQELLQIKNFGQTSLNEIKRRLAEVGLSLRS